VRAILKSKQISIVGLASLVSRPRLLQTTAAMLWISFLLDLSLTEASPGAAFLNTLFEPALFTKDIPPPALPDPV